jgi:hypothetical protein
MNRRTRAILVFGLTAMVACGCAVNRPAPKTVEPAFSYVEDRPQVTQSDLWPQDRGELATGSLNAEPLRFNQPLAPPETRPVIDR